MITPKTVAADCIRPAQTLQNPEPEAPATWHGRLARSLILLTTLALSAQAQLDTSGNGMSDIWERHYNRDNPGQLFDPENPAHHPGSDPDNDGWTNLQESIAGTDPFHANPPDGKVVTYVSYLKDQEFPATPEDPIARISDVAIITWDTLPGKTYTLYSSPTLTAESWTSVWSPIAGTGAPVGLPIEIIADEATKLFWRVEVQDANIDTDNDGLTDYEEYLLQSNPDNPDTSGDGIPDYWLAIHGLNPNEHHGDILFPKSDITAMAAYQAGVQAHADATPDDFDGDGLVNEIDAHPEDRQIAWERTQVGAYALIDLGWPSGDDPFYLGNIMNFNDLGHVLLDEWVWHDGAWHSIQQQSVPGDADLWEINYEYESEYNMGWRFTPCGGVIQLGEWAAYGGPTDIAGVWHTGFMPYDETANGHGGFISTLSTFGPFPDNEVTSISPIGGDAGGRIFVEKSWYHFEQAIWILDHNLEQSGALDFPSGLSLELHASRVTPTGWVAVGASASSQSQSDQTLVWNPDGESISTIGGHLPFYFTGFSEIQDRTIAISHSHIANGKVHLLDLSENAFRPSPHFAGKRIHTFAGNGTAITDDHKIWLNGELVPISNLCPAYQDLLDDGWSLYPFHGNKHGTFLIGGERGEETMVALLANTTIVADTNRDGAVNPASDAHGKDEWNNQRGAIYSVNYDRDETDTGKNVHNGLPMPDTIHFGDDGQANYEHYKIVNADDEDDITPFKIRAIKGLPKDHKVFLRVDKMESMRASHIFKKIEAGEEAIWGSYMVPTPGGDFPVPWVGEEPHQVPSENALELERDITLWTNPNHPDFKETRDDPENQDFFTFGLEGLVLRGMKVPGGNLNQITSDPQDEGKFSGEILLHLEIRDPQDNVVGSDSIRMRVAPWLTFTHEDMVEKIFIREGRLNAVDMAALESTNILEKTNSNGTTWLQDLFEMGYTQRPGGPKHHVLFLSPSNPFIPWVYVNLLGPNMGLFSIGSSSHLRQTGNNQHNSNGDKCGNIETLPPSGTQKLGVLMAGDSAADEMLRFLAAQTFQHHASSHSMGASWLRVGHIDEFTSFLKDRRVAIADPSLAYELMENAIPVADRHKSVFFAKDGNVVAGTLTANTPAQDPNDPDNLDWRVIHTGRDHLTLEDGKDDGQGGRTGYIRFYSGNAIGQVAKVQLFDGHALVLSHDIQNSKFEFNVNLNSLVFVEDLPSESMVLIWDTGDNMNDYEASIFSEPLEKWKHAKQPHANDGFVLIGESLLWQGYTGNNILPGPGDFFQVSYYPGMPAMITVGELLSTNYEPFREVNQTNVKDEINASIQALNAIAVAAGANNNQEPNQPITYIPMPALFFAKDNGQGGVERPTPTAQTAGARAFNPGPTNLLDVRRVNSHTLFIAKQFGPRANEQDIYEQHIDQSITESIPETSNAESVVFIDTWSYHLGNGQIHCGSNVVRKIPSEPWWEKLPDNNP